jgi:phosphopantetheinyl transferase
MKLLQIFRGLVTDKMNQMPSIQIYLLYIASIPRHQIFNIFHKLHTDDRQRSTSFLHENDRLRFLCGRYLLQEYLHDFNISETLQDIEQDAYKRPVLKKTSFSISHSEDCVILAAGPKIISLGIDLEVYKPRYIPDYLDPFCEEEKNHILEENQLYRFYHAWTKKESGLKAIGKGFLHNPLDINTKKDHFVYGDKKYNWINIKLTSDVISNLCHDQNEITLKINKIPD